MNILDNIINIFAVILYFIILAVLFFGFLLGISAYLRRKREKKEQYSLTFLQVKVSPDNEIEIAAAEQMFAGLAGIKKPFWKALFDGFEPAGLCMK
jgi:hypothetical protein